MYQVRVFPAWKQQRQSNGKSRYGLFRLLLFLLSLMLVYLVLSMNNIDKEQHQATKKVNNLEIQHLQTAWKKQPNDLQLSYQLASYYIEQGQQSDKAFYHYLAETTLQPWWHHHKAPSKILELRAYLYQARHQFSLARMDLQQLLLQHPNDHQAAFRLAMLEQIQGDYQEAFKSCKKIAEARNIILSSLCQTSIMGVNGKAQQAYDLLKILSKQVADQAHWQQWTETTMADLAARLDQPKIAEQHFKQALAIPLNDA